MLRTRRKGMFELLPTMKKGPLDKSFVAARQGPPSLPIVGPQGLSRRRHFHGNYIVYGGTTEHENPCRLSNSPTLRNGVPNKAKGFRAWLQRSARCIVIRDLTRLKGFI